MEGIEHRLADIQRQVLQIQKQSSSKMEIQELQDDLRGHIATLMKAEADSGVEIEALSARIEELQAKLEDTNYRLAQLSQQIAATNQELKAVRSSPPVRSSVLGGGDVDESADPESLYQTAYNDYLRGNYDLAILAFRQYLETFPDTDLADNASYWIGECYYQQSRFREAIREFENVLNRFPLSDKTASSSLKKGYAYLELGEEAQGIVQLQHVIRKYPTSDEANLARQRLQSLGVDSRRPGR
jgi:tol-pal system protein YbgF